jgi:ergothioneine biosynthesis protein EgtB
MDAMTTLLDRYRHVRQTTVALCRPLAIEDFVVQSAPHASPTKWHLAHTSWFFEEFVLREIAGYGQFDPAFTHLFNSYYQSVGSAYARDRRGVLSRPTVAQVFQYREHVDAQVCALIGARELPSGTEALIVLGLHHEQQHQELMLTDIKHALACNPLLPAYQAETAAVVGPAAPLSFAGNAGGVCEIGNPGGEFHFDNESPRHKIYLQPFLLANRPVTNGDFQQFIRAGGYAQPTLWLSDGWAAVLEEGWYAPLYWSRDLNSHFTLSGQREIDVDAPVCHVSYYEADAFARWADARLPAEGEWEVMAQAVKVAGNFVESRLLRPASARYAGAAGANAPPCQQMFGDVWEWTRSAYAPYPGFRPLKGRAEEYNGKFMINQMVLRGGSCVTPQSHMRSTYRNFFQPNMRWQFSGIRLAKDST